MRACIKRGVSKVNVNKLILDDYLQFIKTKSSELSLTTLMEQGIEKVVKLMEEQMDVCMSSGKVTVLNQGR